MGLILESIVWLMLSKYSFQKNKCYVHNIFYNTFTTNRKGQVVIGGQKNNFSDRFWLEPITT